jgi:hypothetical protein
LDMDKEEREKKEGAIQELMCNGDFTHKQAEAIIDVVKMSTMSILGSLNLSLKKALEKALDNSIDNDKIGLNEANLN